MKLVNCFILFVIILLCGIPNKPIFSSVKSLSSFKICDTVCDTLIIKDKLLIKSGLLYNKDKDKVVWGKNINKSLPMASLTKIMTALIILEDINSGKFSYDTKVKVTKESTLVLACKIYISEKEIYTIKDLLKASLICSANDACYLLAQYSSGSEIEFVKKMNKRAIELGMNNTFYYNSTGLPSKHGDNRSSSYDLLLLSKEILCYNDVLDITSSSSDIIYSNKKRKIIIGNHNALVYKYNEIIGLKTGWTINAGSCIVASTKRCDNETISIILGSPKRDIRNNNIVLLNNRYYESIGEKILN